MISREIVDGCHGCSCNDKGVNYSASRHNDCSCDNCSRDDSRARNYSGCDDYCRSDDRLCRNMVKAIALKKHMPL